MDPMSTTSAKGGAPDSFAQQIRDDIEETLRGPGHGAGSVEDAVKGHGRHVWHAMRRHPYLVMAALGAGCVAAAAAVGASELAFGCTVAFAAYKVLRSGAATDDSDRQA
jgi:hypothetical protein